MGDRPPRRPAPRGPSPARPDISSGAGLDFVKIQRSTEFVRLRRTHRRFVFPLCLFFFCWYMLYVLLAAYAHDFMNQPVFGQVNVGLLLGGAQFVSTGLITLLYLRFARRRLDPQVDAIRDRFLHPDEEEQPQQTFDSGRSSLPTRKPRNTGGRPTAGAIR